MNFTPDYPALDDRQLVELHLAGDWRAFRQIVERHQPAICALTLSACGQLARSEDLAQEVFIAAWKQLPQLREPAKLRGWLCGIARNLSHNALRASHRTPTTRAAELSPETPADAANPRDEAIGADQAALMWRALESLPETYREPMVLFYREHRSAAAVAETLEISEDLVRQRLARGRAMLTERMAALVEETLERSAPVPAAFAGAVLLGLPVGVAPAVIVAESGLAGGAVTKGAMSAASVGAAAAKGSLAIKALATLAALPVLLTGLTDYLRFRAHLASAAAGEEADVTRGHVLPLVGNVAVLAIIALVLVCGPIADLHPFVYALIVAGTVATAGVLTARYHQRLGKKMAATRRAQAFEYRSRGGWLGLPWVHVRAGGEARLRRAQGWIAISDGCALGGLFASGPVAIAPLAVGPIVIGGFGLGGIVLAFGALGGMAAGWWAAGGVAAGWQAAWGGVALAHAHAAGGIAIAAEANTAAAHAYFAGHPFFQFVRSAWSVALWTSFFTWVPPLLLIGWHAWRAKRSRA